MKILNMDGSLINKKKHSLINKKKKTCSPVEQFDEVSDSICVGQRNADGEERVVLFVKLLDGGEMEEKGREEGMKGREGEG